MKFCIFLRKIEENIDIFLCTAELMQMMPKHIFWSVVDCSSMYATGVIRSQGVVLCWVGGHGHFRSHDKDGIHTIRFAMVENLLLYANCTALSSIELELLPIEVLKFYIAGIASFVYFCKKIAENIKIFPQLPITKPHIALLNTWDHYDTSDAICYTFYHFWCFGCAVLIKTLLHKLSLRYLLL